MRYTISYPQYAVNIQENVGLYKHIYLSLDKQFPISIDQLKVRNGITNWEIVFKSGLIEAYKNKCIYCKKIEHNMECFYYKCEEFSLFLSTYEDWLIKLRSNQTIYIEVDSDTTAFFVIRKILNQISRYENGIRNNVLLHSSCLVKNNKGIAFTGKKGAGKTTILMNLLLNEKCGYKYLGNDIIAVDSHLKAYAVYSKIGVGAETLANLNRQKETNISIRNQKYYYDLGEFLEVFKISCLNSAQLSAIFILDCSHSEEFSCRLCDPEEAVMKIRDDVLQEGKHDELSDHPDWLNIRSQITEFVDVDDVSKHIVNMVPCHLIRYNLQCKEHYVNISEIIQEITR